MAIQASNAAGVGVKAVTKDLAALENGAWGAVGALVAGESKARIAWAGFSQFFLIKILGPVGLFSSVALGATIALNKMGKAFAEMGMESAKSMESLTLRFKPLLAGLESAKKRMEELASFSSQTPFQLTGVVEANQTLQSLTKGALSTVAGMKLVGDAAAVAGVPMEDMAVKVGRLYDGLQSGRPVGEVALHLQELGVISGTTRNQLESMQESGRAGSDVWKVAAADIGKASGAMAAQMTTLRGLTTNLDDNKEAFQRAFANNYLEGEKAMVESVAGAYKNLTPAISLVGQTVSYISNAWDKFRAGIIDVISKSTVVQGTIIAIGAAFSTLSAAVLAATTIYGGSWLLGLTKSAGLAKEAAQGYDLLGASMKLMASSAKEAAIGDAGLAVIQREQATIAAQEGVEIIKKTGAMGALGGATKTLLGVIKSLTIGMVEFLASAVFDPLVLAAAAVIGLVVSYRYMANAQKEAKQELVNLSNAIVEHTALLDKQRLAIRTIADLNAQYAAELTNVADAYEKLGQAKAKSDLNPNDQNLKTKVSIAQEGVRQADSAFNKTKGIKYGDLAFAPGEQTEAERLAKNRELAESQFSHDLNKMSPEGQVSALREKKAEYDRLAAENSNKNKEFEDTQANAATAGANRGEIQAKIDAAIHRRDQLSGTTIKTKVSSGGDYASEEDTSYGDAVASRAKGIKEAQDEADKLYASLHALPDAAVAVDKALASGDALVVLKTKLGWVEALATANERLQVSTQSLVDADKEYAKASQDGDEKAKKAAADKQNLAKKAVENYTKDVQTATNVVGSHLGMDPNKATLGRQRDIIQGQITEVQSQRNEASSKGQDMGRVLSDKEKELSLAEKTEEYETSKKQAELDNLGPLNLEYALKIKILQIEESRLKQLRADNQISQSQLDHGIANLAIEKQSLDVVTRRTAMAAKIGQDVEGLSIMASGQDASGDTHGALESRNRQRVEERKAKQMEIEDFAKSHFANKGDQDDYIKTQGIHEDEKKKQADEEDKNRVEYRDNQSDRSLSRKGTETDVAQQLIGELEAKKKLIDLDAEELENKRKIGAITEKELANGMAELALENKRIEAEQKRATIKSKLAQDSAQSSIDEENDQYHNRPISAQHDKYRRQASDRAIREQELKDEAMGLDQSERYNHIKKGLSQFDAGTKRENRGEGLDGARAALNKVAEGWLDFLNAFKELMDKVREYRSQLQVKELRATGNDDDAKKADRIESQKAFDSRVKDIMKDTGTSKEDATAYVNREMKADHDAPINKNLKELKDELAKKQEELKYDQAHQKREYHQGMQIVTKEGSIGGSMALRSASYYKTDAEKTHQDLLDIKKILTTIQQTAGDSYVVHSVSRPVIDTINVATQGGMATIKV
jgi:hypothetical protein